MAPPSAAGLSGPGIAGTAAGKLGSFTLPGYGSDTPWLPAATLTELRVTAGTRLEVRLVDGSLIATWQAVYAAATDTGGSSVRGLGQREIETPGLASITLDPMPAGSWVVMVHLRFATGGDAAYYWFVTAS